MKQAIYGLGYCEDLKATKRAFLCKNHSKRLSEWFCYIILLTLL
ncbi:hypothetical protein ACUL41_12100 [Virgibacillus natechei]